MFEKFKKNKTIKDLDDTINGSNKNDETLDIDVDDNISDKESLSDKNTGKKYKDKRVKKKKEDKNKSKNEKEKKGLFNRKKKDKDNRIYTFDDYPFLLDLKPRNKYVFHSDYFKIDNHYATILSFFHNDSAVDAMPPFWGINRIPNFDDPEIMVIIFDQVERMGETWIRDHQKDSDFVSAKNEEERQADNDMRRSNEARQTRLDLLDISKELSNGASYLNIHNRIMIKAPTLEKLDKAVDDLERIYIDRFSSLKAFPYPGEQRNELANLFRKNSIKKGHGFYMTSTEYAGSYHLVTQGINDPDGEYVGYMVGDVNNSAIIFNINNYKERVVIASEAINERLERTKEADIWGSKISQSALLSNKKVVHIILDGVNLDIIGKKFENITSRIDMNTGDVNMFEMFGSIDDELSVYSQQMEKIILMVEQIFNTTEDERAIVRGSLEKILTDFYIDKRMYRANAKENRDKLRLVGIPHIEVPKLQEFVSYLDTELKAANSPDSPVSPNKVKALEILEATFNNLLHSNGDLFNVITKDNIDNVVHSSRVLYDFSQLMPRGLGIAMAQLVNIIGFAVGNLGLGDTVIFHGAEMIDDGVKDYINTQLKFLRYKGGRVVFLYNDIDNMLDDKKFNQFDKADYTIFGNMTETTAMKYQDFLGQKIPNDLIKPIVSRANHYNYIRREFDNIVFQPDLSLGIDYERRERMKARKSYAKKSKSKTKKA